jgi:hypothetical protein
MNVHELKWSQNEKIIARTAFDLALKNEMTKLKNELCQKVSKNMTNKEVWALEEFLSKYRKDFDNKYDYRYSQLPRVFGVLISEGFISLNDLKGLSTDKIEAIKLFSNLS